MPIIFNIKTSFMRKFILLFLIFVGTYSFAQTNIGGVINHYAEVKSINYCDGKIAVDSTGNFAIGERILIIQMQGTTIDESNDSRYGTITDLRAAGHYEIASIKNKNLDTIVIENYLVNRYTIAGNVQIISYPKYDNALIVNELSARQWNGIKGGVLAFEVENELAFAAGIDVSGTGFRGGITTSEINNCTGTINNGNLYFYQSGNWRGAEKGEGISNKITGKENGRGAQATGGGGGNDHNSGGGGGANISAGGSGGERDTNFLTGDCKGQNPGVGGKFSTRETNRIFMGGGGGAGHSNNNVGTDGGAGGGIVLMEVGSISGQNFQIKANGNSAINTTGGDGGGGGGAGGSVILKINQPSTVDSIIVEIEGGKGADVFNDITSTCFGPGGGGSGGYVFSNITNINSRISTAGGANGVSTNSTRNGCGANNATVGADGVLANNFTDLIAGTMSIGSPIWQTQPDQAVLICPDGDFMLIGEASGLNPTYQWQIFDGSNFVNLSDDATTSGTQTATLSMTSVRRMMDQSQFRLVVTDACGAELISNTTILTVQSISVSNFSFTESSGVYQFDNLSMNATSYLWEFGDGNTSTDFEPTHAYPINGTYTVTLRVSGPCGVDEFIETITVMNILDPIANFTANDTEGCAPFSVQFQNQSTNANSYSWFFPGGMPVTSNDQNPVVVYQIPGTYTAVLAVENGVGFDTLEQVNFILVNSLPTADFDFNIADLSVQFNDRSIGATTYSWDFGDGNTSVMQNPMHTYSISGNYDVKLIVENDCGTAEFSITISVGGPPTADFSTIEKEGCAPFSVQFQNQSQGATSYSWFFPGGIPTFSNDENPIVVYNSLGSYTAILAVENAIGVDTSTQSDFIIVTAAPTSNFNFSGTGRDIQFNNLSIGGLTYSWDFGDGNTSTLENPVHTYTADGFYEVTLIVTNDCGDSTFSENLSIGGSPIAAFENNLSNGCAPLTVTFTDISTGVVSNREWIFPGGDVTTSANQSLTVRYFTPGIYDVILIVENQFGKDSLIKSALIEVQPRPFAGFEFDVNDLEVSFTNSSTQATNFEWDFGDGKTSNEENPNHTFPSTGDYFVTLNASNDFCSSSITFTVPISTNSAKDILNSGLVKVFPNPVGDILKIEIESHFLNNLNQIELIDINGRILDINQEFSSMNQMNVSTLPSGIYLLRFRANNGDWVSRFIKQ